MSIMGGLFKNNPAIHNLRKTNTLFLLIVPKPGEEYEFEYLITGNIK